MQAPGPALSAKPTTVLAQTRTLDPALHALKPASDLPSCIAHGKTSPSPGGLLAQHAQAAVGGAQGVVDLAAGAALVAQAAQAFCQAVAAQFCQGQQLRHNLLHHSVCPAWCS